MIIPPLQIWKKDNRKCRGNAGLPSPAYPVYCKTSPIGRIIFITCAILVICIQGYGQHHDTLQVFFPLDKNQLTEEATHYIESIIQTNILERGRKMILLGFGDYLGTSNYNNSLSLARARNVEDYLLLSGFRENDITLVIGKGKINQPSMTGKTGNAIDRKVQIIFDRRPDTPANEKFRYYLLRLQENETIALKNIHFFRGSLRITPESLPELTMLEDFLQENATWKIQLEGHVCCLGPEPGKDEHYDESTLSQKRAETIRDSLVAHGVDRGRLLCVGLGNNNPITDEVTLEEQELNRRVEVRVIGK